MLLFVSGKTMNEKERGACVVYSTGIEKEID